MNKFIATFAYVGLLRPAPGTWGSAAAIPVAWLTHWALGFPGFVAVGIALFLVGWWATAGYTRGTGIHDPSEVVIDEVVGMFIALAPLSGGLWFAGVAPHVFPYPGWIGGFVLFRIFDIWKPSPIGWA
ncbi:MAG TPA: phosphatidylglycerophosphatase A, partial [Aliiroseovarius sp.]|nr:phosphatidylglycerophosphatase A [Aliiroseovarius sp.]